MRDLNSQPNGYEPLALTIELTALTFTFLEIEHQDFVVNN